MALASVSSARKLVAHALTHGTRFSVLITGVCQRDGGTSQIWFTRPGPGPRSDGSVARLYPRPRQPPDVVHRPGDPGLHPQPAPAKAISSSVRLAIGTEATGPSKKGAAELPAVTWWTPEQSFDLYHGEYLSSIRT